MRAGLIKKAEDYRWSSARAHLTGSDDGLVTVKTMLDRVSNRSDLLSSDDSVKFDDVRMHERSGRPLGEECFIEKVSMLTGRDLAKKKPGPKQSNR